MKRIIALVMVVALMTVLAGCGKEETATREKPNAVEETMKPQEVKEENEPTDASVVSEYPGELAYERSWEIEYKERDNDSYFVEYTIRLFDPVKLDRDIYHPRQSEYMDLIMSKQEGYDGVDAWAVPFELKQELAEISYDYSPIMGGGYGITTTYGGVEHMEGDENTESLVYVKRLNANWEEHATEKKEAYVAVMVFSYDDERAVLKDDVYNVEKSYMTDRSYGIVRGYFLVVDAGKTPSNPEGGVEKGWSEMILIGQTVATTYHYLCQRIARIEKNDRGEIVLGKLYETYHVWGIYY